MRVRNKDGKGIKIVERVNVSTKPTTCPGEVGDFKGLGLRGGGKKGGKSPHYKYFKMVEKHKPPTSPEVAECVNIHNTKWL